MGRWVSGGGSGAGVRRARAGPGPDPGQARSPSTATCRRSSSPRCCWRRTNSIPAAPRSRWAALPTWSARPGAPGFARQGWPTSPPTPKRSCCAFRCEHPDLRIIFNVTEGLYRIVARRSAGIASVADLKGKRVATIAPTSAGYFLHRMLATRGAELRRHRRRPARPALGDDRSAAQGRGRRGGDLGARGRELGAGARRRR